MLPNLIVIGAGKCGTTSLHRYLDHHPEVSMSATKELAFFVREANWGRGRTWYESQFGGSARVRGEASPQYTKHPCHGGVPERIHSIVPDAKLIYLVRDPIERLVSYYLDRYATGQDEVVLADAIAASPDDYVSPSRYCMQLERYLPYFPLERILVVEQERLLTDRRETLREVFRFSGVDETYDDPRFDQPHNLSSSKRRRNASIARPVVDEDVRESLSATFAPYVERLRRLTGKPFERWSV